MNSIDRSILLKVVPDPISGLVDVRSVLPIVETREFQALRDKRQLGMTYLVFPAAMHTRFSHCLGAYKATKTLADRWFLQGFINKGAKSASNLCAGTRHRARGVFAHYRGFLRA